MINFWWNFWLSKFMKRWQMTHSDAIKSSFVVVTSLKIECLKHWPSFSTNPYSHSHRIKQEFIRIWTIKLNTILSPHLLPICWHEGSKVTCNNFLCHTAITKRWHEKLGLGLSKVKKVALINISRMPKF